jgi:hypothetical protein
VSTGLARPLIGLVPVEAHTHRPRLVAALEQALDVRIVGRAEGEWDGLDGVVRQGSGDGAPVPVLTAAGDEPQAPSAPRSVELAALERLDRCLHGARLHDAWASPLRGAGAGEAVLATVDGRPAWTAAGDSERVFALPAELEPGEALRDRLAPGRSLALLALVHFLRRVAGPRGWQRPPLRAAIIIDDPNLHWPTYGHVRYRELARHAEREDYHVAMAMVPLDAWLVHPEAARIFRAAPRRLSLLVHGNDHEGPELGRPASVEEGRAVAAQALRRIATFERRAGVPVSRVMAPPHEALSEPLLRALVGCGYEAVSTTRPYPWVATEGHHWLERPPGAGALAGWPVADVVAGGLPVLLRQAFPHPREDLVLRAFLGQALIAYGHHDDLAAGPDALGELAAVLRRMGDVRWGPLDELSRQGAETRLAGDTLHVRLHARLAEVDLPPGVARVAVEAPPDGVDLAGATLAVDGREVAIVPGEPVDAPGAGTATIAIAPAAAVAAPPAPRRLWPVARRLAGEGRDRAKPVIAGARRVRRAPAR